MEKMLQGQSMQHAIRLLVTCQVHVHIPVFKRTPKLLESTLDHLQPISDIAVFFAYMHVKDPAISVNSWVKAWKISNIDKQAINHLVEMIILEKQSGQSLWFIYQLNRKYEEMFIELYTLIHGVHSLNSATLSKKRNTLPIESRSQLAISGGEIKQMYPSHPNGPWIGSLLEKVEYNIVMQQLENKNEKIKEWILCHPPEIN